MAMSDSQFNQYLAKILSARYGEEVRGSIHDSLQGMYEIVKGNVLDVTTAKQTIDTAAAAANSAAEKANSSATKADTATSNANAATSAANTAAGKANASATKADTSAAGADTAKNAANTAAGEATKATSAANEAASSASTATDRANAAAKAAEDIVVEKNIATKDYVTEQIDGIEIGGTNFLNGTNDLKLTPYGLKENYKNGFFRASASKYGEGVTYDVVNDVDFPNPQIKSAIHMKRTSNGNAYCNILQDFVPLENYSGDLTMSCYAKGEKILLGLKVIWLPDTEKPNITNEVHKYFDEVSSTKEWKRFSTTFHVDFANADKEVYDVRPSFSINDTDLNKECDFYICGLKLERGNCATDWSPSPDDVDAKIDGIEIENKISRRAPVTYDYGGRNLKEVFGTPKALHDALAVEDYSQIAVGDYWPITLNGTFWDYGSYTVKSDVKYYSNNTLQTQAGTTAEAYEGAYVSDAAVSFELSGATYYASTSDCLPYYARKCNNVTVKLEVAGINHYWRCGDKGELTGNKPHIVFISRDCLPFVMRMRKANNLWENTEINNPWIGSAMFKTLNDETHGVLPLVAATDVGAYIYAGPNKLGMRAMMETKAPDAANATGCANYDRGKLFLPSAAEVCGHPFWAEMNWEFGLGLGNQFAIFRDSLRHISKSFGDNAGRTTWWFGSSLAGNITKFIRTSEFGFVTGGQAYDRCGVPVCFIFA